MRRIWVAATALATCVVASPAQADTRTRTDGTPDAADLPAAHDLTSVTWDYTPGELVVTARLAEVTRDDVVVTARSSHYWEGYEVVARTWWRDGRKVRRLWIWFNTVERTPVACPDMRASWGHGRVRLSVPNSCVFDGTPMTDLSVTTTAPGSREVLDRVASTGRLASAS